MKRILISSTSIDLKEYRAQVRKAVENFGLLPEMMEEFPAMDVDAVKGCMDAVDRCNLFIGIYAHRYGYCPAGSDISITEMEFNRATTRNLPRFCFFVEESYPWKPEVVEDEPGKSNLRAFKYRMDATLMRNTFTTPEDLADKIWKSLRHYFDTLYKPFTSPSLDPYRNLSDIELPMIGRADLLNEINRRLFAGETLAVWGVGGMGKTRLAQAVALNPDVIAHFDGVLWAKLGLPPDTLGVLGEWSDELGISYEIKGLTEPLARANVVQSAIGKRRMLLILDDAWTKEAALLLRLNESNCVRLLTTRQPVIADAFAGSNIIKLEELEPAACLELISKITPEAVKVDRAGVEQIIEKMGRLPLGLKIIAGVLRSAETMRSTSRVQHKIKELLEKVEMRLLRLQHVIEIGVEELDEESRQALYALSVFPPKPNSFSEEAALAVTGTSVSVLYRLFDAGLLETAGGDRYMLHQTICDYSRMKYSEDEWKLRMARHYMALVIKTPLRTEQFETNAANLAVLQAETANIIASLALSQTSGFRQELAHIFANLHEFANITGFFGLLEPYTQSAEKAARDIGDLELLGQLLVVASDIFNMLADYQRAGYYMDEGLKVARVLNDSELISDFLYYLADLSCVARTYLEGVNYAIEGLNLAKADLRTCYLLIVLSDLYYRMGNQTLAEEYDQKAYELVESSNLNHLIGSALTTNLARELRLKGEYPQAISHLEKNYERFGSKAGRLEDQIYYHSEKAKIHIETSQTNEAEHHALEAVKLSRFYALPWYLGDALNIYAEILLIRGDYVAALTTFQEAFSLGEKIGCNEIRGLSLFGLARSAYALKNIGDAKRYGEESYKILATVGHFMASRVKAWLDGNNLE